MGFVSLNPSYVLKNPMAEPLELLTERLRLRTPHIDDADTIQSFVADPRVSLTTASIPHPYPEGGAKASPARPKRREPRETQSGDRPP